MPLSVVRLRQLAVCLLLTAAVFSQSPGLRSNDTKLDLTQDPAHFLGRALHLWNPSIAFGQITNQGYGYLFPMGPFHLLGVEAGLPAWVIQRAWMSLLLVTAFLGCSRLATRLGLGTSRTRLLAGLAYALSPRIVTELGGLSSELLPMALLPWTLVPLVGPGARRSPPRAAARSGVAVLLMGAVNATATLAVLVMPAVFVLAGLRDRRGRALALWWALAGGLATFWWIGPLLLQAAYGLPFLDWIETAAVTTRPTSLITALRGTSHWLAYLAVGGQPWWRAAWTLVTSPIVILDTAVVAALGLAGLCLPDTPARRRLVLVVGLGLLGVTAGHVGHFAGAGAGEVHALLDGPLASFRNVHKFDPLIRLPLALGVAHVLTRVPTSIVRPAAVALVVALVGAATPVLAGNIVPAGGYEQLPGYWAQTARWLDARASQGHALLVPGGSLGEYAWGRPLDEPLQGLTTQTTWAVRDAVPLGSAGLTRLLDAVDARLVAGQASSGLSPLLTRMGVRYVVARNDLDRASTGAPLPVLVRAALTGSPGLKRVASFGPLVGRSEPDHGLVADRGLDVPLPTVEVYEVAAGAAPVTTLPQAGTTVLSGGPEGLLALADRGLLAPATVLAGDGPAGGDATRVVTDGLRRREIDFGQGLANGSATLTADDPTAVDQPVADFFVVSGEQHLTTATLVGAHRITASSTAADPTSARLHRTDRQAWSAFDGNPTTSWVSGSSRGARGQWIHIEFDAPRDVTGTTLALLRAHFLGPSVSAVEVRTDSGRARTSLAPHERPQALVVPSGLTRSLTVTVSQLAGRDGPGVVAGFRELHVPGLTVSRPLAVPADAQQESLRGGVVLALDRATGFRPGCVLSSGQYFCSPDLPLPGEEPTALDRTFALRAPQVVTLTGTARPVPGPGLNALLDMGEAVTVSATSSATPDPADRPGALVDGDQRTAWIAGDDDSAPAVTLTWTGLRPVGALDLVSDPHLVVSRPVTVSVDVGTSHEVRTVPKDGHLDLDPVMASSLTVRFLKDSGLVSGDPVTRQLTKVPVGLTAITVPGVTDVVRPRPAAAVELPCGQGPPLALDGTTYPTAVVGTRADLLADRPVLMSVCAPGPDVLLGAGAHRVVGGSRGATRVEGLTLGSPLAPAVGPSRGSSVLAWGGVHREVELTAGPASWLVVHENANKGWRATLDGRTLEAARVDGWQQAWLVPAGAAGRVVLTYTPDRLYRTWLLVGLLAVLLLLALAVRGGPGDRRRDQDEPVQRPLGVVVPAVVGLAVAVLLGGAWGAAALVLGLVVAPTTRWAPWLAGAFLLAAGVVEAISPYAGARAPGSRGSLTQLLCLVSLGLAAAAVGRSTASTAAPGPRPDEG